MAKSQHSNPVTATLSGIIDQFRKQEKVVPLRDTDRIDGKVCLVTGANSGLGFAVAVQLAQRGGRIIMACRSGIPEAGEQVRKLSGSDEVEMRYVDLADLDKIKSFCDGLREEGIELDIAIFNAGVVPSQSRKTPQGMEQMFMVNYFAKFVLLRRLCADGVIPTDRPADPPRVIFVSSESHRSAPNLDIDILGNYADFSMGKVVSLYGYYKLAMTTLARELDHRLNPGDEVQVSVHSLCPGAINSNIAREAPAWSKPLLKVIFGLFFAAPEKAAEPVLYLACSPGVEGQSGNYLHLMTEKEVDERAMDRDTGARLWQRSEELLKKIESGSG